MSRIVIITPLTLVVVFAFALQEIVISHKSESK